jgi:hypothetical protein
MKAHASRGRDRGLFPGGEDMTEQVNCRKAIFLAANPGIDTQGQRAIICTLQFKDGRREEIALPVEQSDFIVGRVAICHAWHEVDLQRVTREVN